MTGSPGSATAATDAFTERLRWQATLFSAAPQRAALRALAPAWPCDGLRIRVHRNHAVEAALTVTVPYLRFAGLEPEWIVGDYDDSLSFGLDGDADVEVVWLDHARVGERLGPVELAGWLAGRLSILREQTPGPILVLDSDGPAAQRAAFSAALENALTGLREVFLADRRPLFAELGDRFFDPSRETLTGTRMSAEGAVAVARSLGSSWIPALVRPRLKAVVVDLDNTLYAGVLGEDGVEGVQLTAGHLEFQRRLAELHESGLFLGLLSRNDTDQVEELFAARADFTLGLEDFDASVISWEAKSQGLAAIAAELRIDPSAVLFVDDNPGELLETALGTPGVHLVHAAETDGLATARAVSDYPGIFSFGRSEEDGLRAADLRANRERERALVRAEAGLAAYYRELAVTLTVGHDQPDQLSRVADMSVKTNQFNLALKRFSPADVERFLTDAAWQVSTIRLEDRLSDSGLIATLLARREGSTLTVAELCISCRAMGRQLEDLMVAQMLVSGPLFAAAERVRFEVATGPRNQPARRWLAAFTGGPGHEVDLARVTQASVNPDVRIEVQP